MSKKGVSKISGPTKPKIGEKAVYKIVEWYPATPLGDRNPIKVTWELFRKRENGNFTTTNIKKKGVGEFTFNPKAVNFTYKVEGYLHSSEGKEPMAILVYPQKSTTSTPSKEKEILGIILTHTDGTKITKPLSYMDRLKAVAKCQNMEGEKLVFTLWEDDEKGVGHNSKNQYIAKSKEVIVDSKGNARWEFTLFNTYIQLANKNEDDTKTYEYYVMVEYNGKHEASININVNNPEHKIVVEKEAKETSKIEKKPVPQPIKESAKVSIYPASKNNTLDEKGLITKLQLLDKNKQPITDRPKFGDTIYLDIDGKDLKGKEFTVKIWEDDNTGENDLLNEGKFIFKEDNFDRVFINLTQEMQQKGEYGKDNNNPDIGEYWTGRFQEIFVEIILESLSVKSQTINIDIDETFKTNYDKSVAVVAKQPEHKKETNCVCKQYDLIWGNKVSCEFRKKVIEIAKELWGEANKIRMANELMVCMAVETGERFTADYGYPNAATGLIQFTGTAITDMNRTGYNGGNTIDKKYLANLTAEKQLDYVKLYFQMWMTKYNKTINNALDMYLTIWCPAATGKANDYVCYSKEKDKANKVNYYESNKSIEYEYYDDKEPILRKRLKKDSSLANGKIEKKDLKPRFKFWTVLGEDNKAKSFTCQIVTKKAEPKKQTNNKWHDPVDNPICTLYMESGGGGELGKKWGLFGMKIRKEVDRTHTGLDLFALTGTNVYACVDSTVYNRRWHSGYGNTITLKVKDPIAFLQFKKDYSLQSLDEDSKGKYWNENGDIYLFYAHLDSVKDFTFGQEVKCGDVIAKTGRSGVKAGTCAPHLHFEIFSSYVMATGTNYRINPAYFVKYKGYNEQSESERSNQEIEKNRGKIKELNGKLALSTNNLF